MNKKGQVALFVAIGIVLLLLAVIFLSQNNSPAQSATYQRTEKISAQFNAVQTFVDGCLDKTTNAGLDLIGQQGGYINPAASGIVAGYPGSSPASSSASGFPFTPGSGTVIPYWYYLAAPMDCSGDSLTEKCTLGTKAPPIDGADPNSIQSQLQNYISTQMDSCLDDFTALNSEGYNISSLGIAQPTVLIRDNDVYVFMLYPLNATLGTDSQKMTQFVADEAVPLRPLYTYALVLTAAQLQYNYLEHHLLSLISYNSGPSTKLLPPTSATTYDYVSTVFWLKSHVQKEIQDLLVAYVPGLRVANAKNFESVTYDNAGISDSTNRAMQRVYNNMILPINSTDTSNTSLNNRFDVSFEYLGWPIYFNVNSNGDIIKPNSLSVSDFLFGFQQYDTYYDVTYPVRVVLRDDTARNGAGYTFAFGLQGNVRGNAPLDENYTLNTGTAGGKSPAQSGTFVCDPDQFNSGTTSLHVVDNVTSAPVSDVQLTYSCGEESCNVGATDANGQWSGKLPICGGGVMTLAKDESYGQRALVVSTNLDTPLALGNVAIQPYRMLFGAVEKKMVEKQPNGDWQFVNAAVPLNSSEYAVVSYTQIDPAFGVDPVSGSFVYYGSSGSDNDTLIKLVPGTYEVTVQTILNQPLIIPQQTRKKKITPFNSVSFTIPEVDFDQFPSGSLELNGSRGYWTVSASDVDSQNGAAANDAVTFYALAPDIPAIPQDKRVVEDLQILNSAESFMTSNYHALLPQFGSSTTLPQPQNANSNAQTPTPIISLQTLALSPITPGSTVQVVVSILGDESNDATNAIKSVAVVQPSVAPPQQYTSSNINVHIPNTASGTTKISLVFTLTDGTQMTASTTVDVESASPLADLSLAVNTEPAGTASANPNVAQPLILSKKTLPASGIVPIKIVATYADGTTQDVTQDESISVGTIGMTDPDAIFTISDGYLHVTGIGSANITAQFGNQSLDVPITITQ